MKKKIPVCCRGVGAKEPSAYGCAIKPPSCNEGYESTDNSTNTTSSNDISSPARSQRSSGVLEEELTDSLGDVVHVVETSRAGRQPRDSSDGE